jgi:DNA-binding PadR family transcriptional regulator
MNQNAGRRRDLWALTVLCLLRIRPMHPYEMQQLIREWHKDEYLDLKRGSLYHAIGRLVREHWIEAMETSREGRRPERTVYCLTDDGERGGIAWLCELLAKPLREPTQFFAALSFLPHLAPKIVLDRLQERVGLLESQIAGLNGVLEMMVPRIGRLVLVEVEYTRAMRQAELAWVKALMVDLRSGALTWNPQRIFASFINAPQVERTRSTRQKQLSKVKSVEREGEVACKPKRR